MKTRIQAFLFALLILFVFAGSACDVQTEVSPALTLSAVAPPLIEKDAGQYVSVRLHFPSVNEKELLSETRKVFCPREINIVEAAVYALCEGPTTPTYAAVVPDGWTLRNIEQSGNISLVYFTGDTPAAQSQLLLLRAALAATVSANGGSPYTDVLFNDMQPGYAGRPLGALAPIETTLETYLADYASNIGTEPEIVTLHEQHAALYFTNATREFLLCDVRLLRYDSEADIGSIAASLVEELFKGPLSSNGREPVCPADMRLLRARFVTDALPLAPIDEAAADTIVQDENAQDENTQAEDSAAVLNEQDEPTEQSGTLLLYFLNSETLAENNERMLVFSSLAYTVIGFLPQVEAVEIHLLNPAIQEEKAEIQSHISTLEHYLLSSVSFTRTDFAGMLGKNVPLHFPLKSGLELMRVQRCLEQSHANSPLYRLQALFDNGENAGAALNFLTPGDVLSVTQSQENMLVVNFAPGFTEKLRSFVSHGDTALPAATRSQMAIFSMINTLCEFPGISRVWFLEDGQCISETVGNIYLGNALYYSPGLTAS